MFVKMTLDCIWPSRFGGLCAAGLPMAPQKPAAAAPATNASAALTLTGLRKVAPINVDGLTSLKVAKGEAATSVADAVLGNMELLSTVIMLALESNAQQYQDKIEHADFRNTDISWMQNYQSRLPKA